MFCSDRSIRLFQKPATQLPTKEGGFCMYQISSVRVSFSVLKNQIEFRPIPDAIREAKINQIKSSFMVLTRCHLGCRRPASASLNFTWFKRNSASPGMKNVCFLSISLFPPFRSIVDVFLSELFNRLLIRILTLLMRHSFFDSVSLFVT